MVVVGAAVEVVALSEAGAVVVVGAAVVSVAALSVVVDPDSPSAALLHAAASRIATETIETLRKIMSLLRSAITSGKLLGWPVSRNGRWSDVQAWPVWRRKVRLSK